jgi:hypothetical protein
MARHGHVVGDSRQLALHLATLLPRAPGMPAGRRSDAQGAHMVTA